VTLWFQIGLGIAVERRRIRHAGIKPQRVEIVADVVVIFDVARRTAERVAAEKGVVNHKADALQHAAIGEAVEPVHVQQEERDQSFDVVGLPAAVDIGLAKPDIAARQCLAQHVPIRNFEMGARSRLLGLDGRHLSVRRGEIQRAELQVRYGLAPTLLDQRGWNQTHTGDLMQASGRADPSPQTEAL
jgi:hypothetical protein